MQLGQIFQSVAVWNKLSLIAMKPLFAYSILKYTRLINADFEIIEKQRVALIHEITDTKEGEDAKIEPNTPEFTEYTKKINEVLIIESSLKKIDVDFKEVLEAIGENDSVLTAQDLAVLEPFFKE